MQIIKQPIFQFVVFGLFLFTADWLINGNNINQEQDNSIFISKELEKNLAAKFKKIWMRPPTASELTGYIESFVRNDIMTKEAEKLGIDKYDEVIMRRLNYKLEMLIAAQINIKNPSDAELKQFMIDHADLYKERDRFTFTQVAIHPNSDEEEIKYQLNAIINKKSNNKYLTHIPKKISQASDLEINKMFGKDFTKNLNNLQTNKWQGPFQSGFAKHFIKIDKVDIGAFPQLPNVREKLIEHWKDEQYDDFIEQYYQEIKSKYKITRESNQ